MKLSLAIKSILIAAPIACAMHLVIGVFAGLTLAGPLNPLIPPVFGFGSGAVAFLAVSRYLERRNTH